MVKINLKFTIIFFTCLLISFFYYNEYLSFLFTKKNSQSKQSQKTVITKLSWQDFTTYDQKTNRLSDQIENKIQKNIIKIPGFIVALETNLRSSKSFLLVPNREYCIHVPPPPPHLMILVQSETPVNIENSWNPVWIEGKLKKEMHNTKTYGEVIWKLNAHFVSEYKWDDEEET